MQDKTHGTARRCWRSEDHLHVKDDTDLLSICHGDLADHSANVNEEVEILGIKPVILTTRAREKIKQRTI